MYDVGAIVRDTQHVFRLFTRNRDGVSRIGPITNRATPEDLALLLGALVDVTNELVAWRAASDNVGWRQRVLESSGIASIAIIDDDLDAWQRRLDAYIFAVSAAPAGDRKAVLWSVTAPLLLGFYGGENSNTPRGVADVATPFRIANMMLVSDDWRGRVFDLWQRDVVDAAVDLATVVPRAVAGAVSGVGALLRVLVPVGLAALVVGALRGRRRR